MENAGGSPRAGVNTCNFATFMAEHFFLRFPETAVA